jgi:hypothetical protein
MLVVDRLDLSRSCASYQESYGQKIVLHLLGYLPQSCDATTVDLTQRNLWFSMAGFEAK